MYDIIIIGAGPAGLTAALYSLRAGKKVLLIDAKGYGGQIVNSFKVENYPGFKSISGYELVTNMYNQVKEYDIDIVLESVKEITETKEVITNKNKYTAKAIIVASGIDNKKLGLNNEMELVGKGISYCATCDGNFFKNKDVAVVGGGNTALEDALYLSNICNKVYLVHRRDEFRGDKTFVDRLHEKGNVVFMTSSVINSINGEEALESIDVLDTKLKETSNIIVEGLFIAVGQEPTNNFENILDKDENGYIIASEDCKTNIEGIYVVGDIRTKKVRQLTTACADGTVAAINAINYIEGVK